MTKIRVRLLDDDSLLMCIFFALLLLLYCTAFRAHGWEGDLPLRTYAYPTYLPVFLVKISFVVRSL